MIKDIIEKGIIMRKYLISESGNFYKSNLHAHSTHSDGEFTPQQMKDYYRARDYSVIAFTDHNVLNYFNELDDENFLALCGYEVDSFIEKSYGGFPKVTHMNAISRDPHNAIFIPPMAEYSTDCNNETIQKLVDANYIVNYNHPSWSAEESHDYLGLKNITAMEIFNYGCEVDTNDGDCRDHYDIMLKHGMKVYCIATDDNHNRDTVEPQTKVSDSCGGFTMLKAPSLTYENIIKSIDTGDFYCSTGPVINALYIEDNKLIIECEPVKGIYFKSNNIGCVKSVYQSTNSLNRAELDLTEFGELPFIRVEIVDENGKMAFTNPYYFD